MANLAVPYELTGAELDAVAAGLGQVGLVNVGVETGPIEVGDVLSRNDVDVTLTNIANGNEIVKNVGVGVAVAAGILGAAGAGNFVRLR